MFNFFVVAARLFLVFCVCPNFDHLAKQRRKIFWGVSEVGKIDFSVYFCRLCVFFLVFFSAAIARDHCARAFRPGCDSSVRSCQGKVGYHRTLTQASTTLTFTWIEHVG